MIYTSRTVMGLRNLTRKLGINRLVGKLLSGDGYEDKFGPKMVAKVRPGDCVWDIGANVGLYSRQFAEHLQGQGRVIAFEPVPACFERLESCANDMPQILPVNCAMGAEDGNLTMLLESDELAATHRVATNTLELNGGRSVTVPVRSGSSVVEERPEWFPNVIKIDVEGFEGAVLDGLEQVLSDRRLRCVGIEVHFGILAERGEKDRPKQMEQLLVNEGFQVEWTDASHLIAVR